MKQRTQGEDGASLLIVLVFMLLISAVTLGLLGFTESSFTATDAVRESRQSTYAADAATELAIHRVVTDKTGDLGTTFGPSCATSLSSFNARATAVACNPLPGSGQQLPNKPLNALLTLSSTTPLKLDGTFDLNVDGRIYSNAGIDVDDSNNSLLRSTATITAEADTDCNGPRVEAVLAKFCSALPTPAGDDPGWEANLLSRPALAALPSPTCPAEAPKVKGPKDPPTTPGPPGPLGAHVVTFSPGTYVLSPTTLFAALATCEPTATFHFLPGTYYFDDIDFDLGDRSVVFGERSSSWLSNQKPPVDGTACVRTGPATQVILGAGSSITGTNPSHNNTVLTMCAGSTPTDKPAIALYGLSAPSGGMAALSGADPAVATSNKPSVFVHGTVYMPTGTAVIALHNRAKTSFANGMVLDRLVAKLNASSTQTEAPISLPACTSTDPCRQPRKVVFTATVAGEGASLRSIIEFTNDVGGSAATAKATLTQWSRLT